MPSIKIENPFLVSCLNSPWTSSKRSLFSGQKGCNLWTHHHRHRWALEDLVMRGCRIQEDQKTPSAQTARCQAHALWHTSLWRGWWLDENILGSSIFASYASVFFLESCSNNKWIGFLAFLEKKNWSLEHSAVNLLITSIFFIRDIIQTSTTAPHTLPGRCYDPVCNSKITFLSGQTSGFN